MSSLSLRFVFFFNACRIPYSICMKSNSSCTCWNIPFDVDNSYFSLLCWFPVFQELTIYSDEKLQAFALISVFASEVLLFFIHFNLFRVILFVSLCPFQCFQQSLTKSNFERKIALQRFGTIIKLLNNWMLMSGNSVHHRDLWLK